MTDHRAPWRKYSWNTGFSSWVSKYRERIIGGVSMISSPAIKVLSRMFSGGTIDADQAGVRTSGVAGSRLVGRCTVTPSPARVAASPSRSSFSSAT